MTRLAVSELRNGLSEVLGKVRHANERVIIHNRGKDIACVVTMDDLRLLEEIEDQGLYALAETAKAHSKETISLEQARQRLGL